MGMRIHCAMGWAGCHPDPQALQRRLYEERVDGEVVSLMQEAVASAVGTPRWLPLFADLGRGHGYPGHFFELVSAVTTDAVKPETLWIIAPPGSRGAWHRRDDDLDYHAKRWRPNWEDEELRWLDSAPYPYGRWSWADGATGEWRSAGDDEQALPGLVPSPPPSVGVLAEALGFTAWRSMKPLLATWWA